MGFLQLIPESEVQASYVIETRELVLHAQGQAQKFTTGYSFQPKGRKDGMLVFALMGWVGPIAQGPEPYDFYQRFENIESPGHFVCIQSANHPQGVHVRVEVVPVLPATSAAAASQAQEQRRIPVGAKLELRAAVWEQRGATQSMKQDPAFLQLESAGIQNPTDTAEIVWALKGLKPGETEVKITSMGGLTPIVTVKTVKVLIEAIPAKK